MKLPASLTGESRVRLLQGIAIGAVATMIVGFYWGGWVTQRTALEMSRSRVDTALVGALAPLCVEKFRSAANAAAKTVELKAERSFMQGQYIARGGWATPVGSDMPNTAVADACANTLTANN